MKKKILTAVLVTLTLAATGCAQKTDSTVASSAVQTTQAAAEQSSEETAEAASEKESETETEDDREQDSASGSVTSVTDSLLTIATANGSEMQFDISEADINQVYELTEGDKVYIEYYVDESQQTAAETKSGETKADEAKTAVETKAVKPLTAAYIEVEEAALAAVMDPVFTGTVDQSDDNTITLTDKRGETYTFRCTHAYLVAQNGIQNGSEARVTYIGELDDSCLATKIVMEDSYETPEADTSLFIGTVVGADPDRIVLSDDDEDYFTFLYDMDDPEEFPDGTLVLVTYEGVLSGKEIPASDVELFSE